MGNRSRSRVALLEIGGRDVVHANRSFGDFKQWHDFSCSNRERLLGWYKRHGQSRWLHTVYRRRIKLIG